MGKGKDEEKIRRSAESQGLPLPDWIKNKPELAMGLEFYYMAFMELCSCRAIGMGEGPIPWIAMVQYAMVHGIDEFERFTSLMFDMDNTYLTERNKKT